VKFRMQAVPSKFVLQVANAQPEKRRLLIDDRELVFSKAFVTLALTDGKEKRAFDRLKVNQILSNSKKEGRKGKPVTATFLETPNGYGTLIMRAEYFEQEDSSLSGYADSSQGTSSKRSIRCKYKAFINIGPKNLHSVALVHFKLNKPRGPGLDFVLDRIRLDTKYACVHFITDARGLLSRGDQALAHVKLAHKRKASNVNNRNLIKRLREEYAENLERDAHEQNEFHKAQIKVVAKVAADPRFAVSLEKMALHGDESDARKFTLRSSEDTALFASFFFRSCDDVRTVNCCMQVRAGS